MVVAAQVHPAVTQHLQQQVYLEAVQEELEYLGLEIIMLEAEVAEQTQIVPQRAVQQVAQVAEDTILRVQHHQHTHLFLEHQTPEAEAGV